MTETKPFRCTGCGDVIRCLVPTSKCTRCGLKDGYQETTEEALRRA